MRRGPAQIDNETDDDEANDGQDLDRCEPELAFAESTGAQKVYDEDDKTSDRNPYDIVDLAVPICKQSNVYQRH